MSSRGAKTQNGHVTTTEYSTSRMVDDAKVLKGNNGAHGLPDYSHTVNRIYIKENPNGGFRMLRQYDDAGKSIVEIAFHVEPKLTGNRHDPVLHYHTIDGEFNRSEPDFLSKRPDLYQKYGKYLKEYGL